jgi:hypothetical protein
LFILPFGSRSRLKTRQSRAQVEREREPVGQLSLQLVAPLSFGLVVRQVLGRFGDGRTESADQCGPCALGIDVYPADWRERHLFASRCNGCHHYPDVSKIDDARWREILSRVGEKASLDDAQTRAVLSFILVVRSEPTTSR